MASENTQKKLLTEQDLTLDRALEVAQSQEAAAHKVRELKGGARGSAEVLNVDGGRKCS